MRTGESARLRFCAGGEIQRRLPILIGCRRDGEVQAQADGQGYTAARRSGPRMALGDITMDAAGVDAAYGEPGLGEKRSRMT